MAKKIKKICCVCDTSYEIFCPSCREAMNQPSWKNIFHDENCRKIYETSSAYLIGKIDDEVARKNFDMCDLTNKNQFKVKFQKVIDEVYAAAKVEEIVEETVETEPQLVELIIEEESEVMISDCLATVENIQNDVAIESAVTVATSTEDTAVVRTNNYRRRKKKKNKMIDSDLEQ